MRKEKSKKFSKGFTFVEVVAGIGVFMLFVAGIYNAYYSLYGSILATHTKTAAIDLINEEFELIKNLPYASVGLAGRDLGGVVLATQSATRDGISFTLNVSIINTDDPFDGVAPNDLLPNDYKLVEVKVFCATCKNFVPIAITGIFSPKNLETN